MSLNKQFPIALITWNLSTNIPSMDMFSPGRPDNSSEKEKRKEKEHRHLCRTGGIVNNLVQLDDKKRVTSFAQRSVTFVPLILRVGTILNAKHDADGRM